MGSQCSALCKKGNECDQKKDEVSTTVKSREVSPLLQRRSSQQEEGGALKETTEEGTLRRQEEETSSEKCSCNDKSSTLAHEYTVIEVNSQSPCLSETHELASANTEEKEANWVDNNRAKLIQNVTLVIKIADEMLQRNIMQEEMYSNIEAARTSQEQMRLLYRTLTSVKAKSAFYNILREVQPETCETEEVVKEVIKKHKAYLREKFRYEFEGTEKDPMDAKSLDKIYTELHIIQGESERINVEHEIWEIEDKAKCQTAEGTKINCNDIFKSTLEDSVSSEQDRGEVRAIRTVMTKGIAGIGKTVSVKKFILDWADGSTNRDLDFIFVLPFRELNLVIDDQFSLETLVREFHPELKNISVARIFTNHKVLFIFDGLDESQLQLNFKTAKRLVDVTKESSVDTLVTNLLREHLLPSALVWITSRPGAIQRIPRQYIYQWTEVRGFNDPQKIQYFRKRVEDKAVAERIINNIMMSRSLYIMCHIPIFCWLAAKVLAHLLLKMDKTQDEDIKIPTTLTEMYTHFLCIQMQVATEKYDKQNESDTEAIFKSNEGFIFQLGRMAFEHLNEGKIIFTANDLKNYDIDIHKAGVNCGLCTEIFKEESVFNTKKLYCFVHLTVQEYFAALFVYHSFARKKIDSLSLKDFLLKGSDEELKPILDAHPVDLPLDELMEISVANSTLRKTGELDMFLRFLIGMSLRSTQELLQGLIQQEEEHSTVVKEIRTSLLEIDLGDCSPERCLNLVHCLIELKDSSLHDTVQKYLKPDQAPETQLSPVQCSALADSILMSNTPLDEFNLKKYRPSVKGIFRLVPAVRNSRKVRISGVDLTSWLCETISSGLRMPNSVLTELHLTNCVFYENALESFIEGLLNSQCKLEALSLSGGGHSQSQYEKLASAIKSFISHLRELELSANVLGGSLCSVLSVVLGSPTLEKLRLNRNSRIAKICEVLVTALTSNPSNLRELELNDTSLKDSEMEILSTWLMSANCTLEVFSLSHNSLTENGCKTLASALSSESSCLTKLDLSYNDLQDSGVMALCDALTKPHCCLQTLRLSFCKVTGDGCAALASALRSDHCTLRDLDLSFNHLTDQGAKLLTEIQMDSHYSLKTLNVDQNEECWFDLKLLRQYACDLTLDPNTAGVNAILTEENKKATHVHENQPYSDHPDRFDSCQVLCEEGLTGRHYWEVDCDSADVGVAYKSIDRAGDCSSEFSLGQNEKSWCWCYDGCFYHNYSHLNFLGRRTYRSTIGVYLDWPAGILSFYEVFPDALTHLYTVHTTFSEPLHPGFSFSNGSIHLRKLK
ncbi:NLR family CARD domain-containing protein 3-like isoform X1 [Epinephelus fuscoguttatus]|uniref:NLR family CARD domain-containing protein 3-like isoform X1 n=1 Tax=Epinephelus fuscoguttatus TaxID=293821 RepID=UPI0020D1C56C|nr:NLR family CARD domain-containing protein 3-like isoform X1 [Epinephelus fuscoguttatus]